MLELGFSHATEVRVEEFTARRFSSRLMAPVQ
jgi:hypothetical protein